MVKKDYNKVYGFCRVCRKYVPRDDMISTNFVVYGEGIDEKEDKIRIRLCPSCHKKQFRLWKSIEWKGIKLKRACEIMIDERLASMCDDIDFDNQDQNAVFEATK
jgi:hypothetical protein